MSPKVKRDLFSLYLNTKSIWLFSGVTAEMYPLVGATLLGTLEVGKSSTQVRKCSEPIQMEPRRMLTLNIKEFVFQEVLGKEVFTEAVAAAVAEG